MPAAAPSRDGSGGGPATDQHQVAMWREDAGTSCPVDALWIPIGYFFAAAAIMFMWSGFELADPAAASICVAYAIGGLAARACAKRDLRPRLALMTGAISQIGMISTAGMMLTYAAATLGRPLIDGQLLRFDTMVGYGWHGYAAFVHSGPTLMSTYTHAYTSMLAMPLVATIVLSTGNDARRIRQYILATGTSLILGIGLFSLWPATTAWVHLGTSGATLGSYPLLPTAREGWIHDLVEIRAGRGLVVNTFGSGLIAFPSFHCIFGILFSWVVWTKPRLRIPALLASIATIASAPILGGHYLADLAAGAAVAAASIAAAISAERRLAIHGR